MQHSADCLLLSLTALQLIWSALTLHTDTAAQEARRSSHGHVTVIGEVAECVERELQEGSLVQHTLKILGKARWYLVQQSSTAVVQQ
jgi:hypothetical protein